MCQSRFIDGPAVTMFRESRLDQMTADRMTVGGALALRGCCRCPAVAAVLLVADRLAASCLASGVGLVLRAPQSRPFKLNQG